MQAKAAILQVACWLMFLAACAPTVQPPATPQSSPADTATQPSIASAPAATVDDSFAAALEDATPYQFPPTVTAAPSACEDTPRATRLIVMQRGIVTEDTGEEADEKVNVRRGPGTNNAVVGQLDIGDVFVVLEGPTCSPEFAWFRVQSGGTVGWIAEGDDDSYYVAPYLVE